MRTKTRIMPFVLSLFAVYIISGLLPHSVMAGRYNQASANPEGSKRIEVYALSQSYWDTKYGDTLSEIILQLLPNNPSKHAALMRDIVDLNPQAFIDADPERLIANKRLWLPGYMKQQDTKTDPETTIVESYSWGNIKRQR